MPDYYVLALGENNFEPIFSTAIFSESIVTTTMCPPVSMLLAEHLMPSPHWCLKRDLHISTNDLLGVIQSFERTVINQHVDVQQQIDDEQIKKQLHHQEFLFRSLFGKIANRAIRLVIKIREALSPCRTW